MYSNHHPPSLLHTPSHTNTFGIVATITYSDTPGQVLPIIVLPGAGEGLSPTFTCNPILAGTSTVSTVSVICPGLRNSYFSSPGTVDINFLGARQVGLYDFSITTLPTQTVVVNAEGTITSTGTTAPGFTDTVTGYLSTVSVSDVAYSTDASIASVTVQGLCPITTAPITATSALLFPTLSVPTIVPNQSSGSGLFPTGSGRQTFPSGSGKSDVSSNSTKPYSSGTGMSILPTGTAQIRTSGTGVSHSGTGKTYPLGSGIDPSPSGTGSPNSSRVPYSTGSGVSSSTYQSGSSIFSASYSSGTGISLSSYSNGSGVSSAPYPSGSGVLSSGKIGHPSSSGPNKHPSGSGSKVVHPSGRGVMSSTTGSSYPPRTEISPSGYITRGHSFGTSSQSMYQSGSIVPSSAIGVSLSKTGGGIYPPGTHSKSAFSPGSGVLSSGTGSLPLYTSGSGTSVYATGTTKSDVPRTGLPKTQPGTGSNQPNGTSILASGNSVLPSYPSGLGSSSSGTGLPLSQHSPITYPFGASSSGVRRTHHSHHSIESHQSHRIFHISPSKATFSLTAGSSGTMLYGSRTSGALLSNTAALSQGSQSNEFSTPSKRRTVTVKSTTYVCPTPTTCNTPAITYSPNLEKRVPGLIGGPFGGPDYTLCDTCAQFTVFTTTTSTTGTQTISVPGSTGSDTVTSTQTLDATTITNYATSLIHDIRAGTVVTLPANCVSTNAATTAPSPIGCSLLGSPPADAVCGETGQLNLIPYSSFPVNGVPAQVCANACLVDTECLSFGLRSGDTGKTLCQFYSHSVSDGGYSTDNNPTVDSVSYDLSCFNCAPPTRSPTTFTACTSTAIPNPHVPADDTCDGQGYVEIIPYTTTLAFSAQECANACLQDSKCASVSFRYGFRCNLYDRSVAASGFTGVERTEYHYDRSCYLCAPPAATSSSPPTTALACAATPVVDPPANDLCNLEGFPRDLATISANEEVSVQVCADECLADAACLSFSYDSLGYCTLYSQNLETGAFEHQDTSGQLNFYDRSCYACVTVPAAPVTPAL